MYIFSSLKFSESEELSVSSWNKIMLDFWDHTSDATVLDEYGTNEKLVAKATLGYWKYKHITCHISDIVYVSCQNLINIQDTIVQILLFKQFWVCSAANLLSSNSPLPNVVMSEAYKKRKEIRILEFSESELARQEMKLFSSTEFV